MRTRRTLPSTVPEARVELIVVGAAVEEVAIFIGTVLTLPSSRSLQSLLGTSIGVANLKRQLLGSNKLSVEIPDDNVADVAGFKAAEMLALYKRK